MAPALLLYICLKFLSAAEACYDDDAASAAADSTSVLSEIVEIGVRYVEGG